MKIDIHHYHHSEPAIEQKLDRILKLLNQTQEKLMLLLDTLAADVEANTNAAAGLEQVLDTVVQELKDLQANSGNTIDPAALKAITDKIEANTATIVAKTLANTPAAAQVPTA